MNSPPAPDRSVHERIAAVVFLLLLLLHVWGVSIGWHHRSLPGQEFRQTQTAISALFIQRENNFSLRYPTPVLGKPWSIPFEFPLYQWTVVVTSNALDLPLAPAARLVSAACFYLTLPAFWLLLARMGASRIQRWIVLGLIVSSPLHIFYSRSFLIETMALLFGVWFLWAYIAGVERRSWAWIAAAVATGTLAGLVKVTTFMVWLIPAAAWSLWWLWRDWRGAARWRALGRRLGWIAAAVAIPFAATIAWIEFADSVKARNPSGAYLLSSGMHSYNFGTWETRFARSTWDPHWEIMLREIAPPAVLAMAGAVALLFARRWWGWMAGCVAVFFAAQIMFPILYAWHEYYWVANTAFLMIALGLGLAALFHRTSRPWSAWIAFVLVVGTQLATYARLHLPHQRHDVRSAEGLSDALQRFTEPDDVLVICGEDWSSIIPYYAGRRAFMIRRNMEYAWEMIYQNLTRLEGEPVTALLLRGDHRGHGALIQTANHYFGIEMTPVARWNDIDIYLRKDRADVVRAEVGHGDFHMVQLEGKSDPFMQAETEVRLMPEHRQRMFESVRPRPMRFYSTYGLASTLEHGKRYLIAHPDVKLWFQVPPGRRVLETEVLIAESAYRDVSSGQATDGVEFAVHERTANDEVRLVFSRWLNPRDNFEDRGLQQLRVEFDVAPGSEVIFTVGPGGDGNYQRDWSAVGPVTIH